MAHDVMFMGGTGEPIVFNNNQQQHVSPEAKQSFGSRLASALIMGAPTMKEKGGKVKKCQNGESFAVQEVGRTINTPKGPIYETEDGYFDVDGRAVRYENKIGNIKDRHNSAKQEVFTDGRTAYVMTTGKDLDLFNNYTGDRDTLIQVVRGFKNPKKFENESLGHKFEVEFPGIAEFLGYKSGYLKNLEKINELKKKK